MSTLFDIPSRRFAKLARARPVGKGYPEYDESQPRAADGTWGGGGGSGGAKKPSNESGGVFGRLVNSLGGVALVASGLAALGVPGVRSVHGLRQLRSKVLGLRTRSALSLARGLSPAETRAWSGQGGAGPYVRAETQALRGLRRTVPLKPSQAEMNRLASRSKFGPRYDAVSRSFGNQRPVRRAGERVRLPRHGASTV